jgi:DNA-binding response OmpR family regulator
MSRTILYAEDEPGVRELIGEELRRIGYVVETVGDGESAIRILDEREFDLLLLDIKMPRKSGLDVLTHLKEKGLKPRVIMLTGVDDLATAVEAVKLGATDYVTKPAGLEALLASIRRVLGR